jgi:hypothetical protein
MFRGRELSSVPDEELVGPRTITACTEDPDGGWNVTLSCGHEALFVIPPASMEIPGCAQCIEILVDRQNMRRERK